MDAAPIWTDLKSFPWAEFRDRVDILTGGYPCQPFSAAGKRLGTEDPRHLWPFIADGIRLLRPRLCFFENVEGHISLGLREVVGELEQIGYSTAWGIFSASEVGAPHQRKRVFILAYDQHQGLERLGEFCPSLGRSNERLFIGNGCSREELANDSGAGLQGNFSGLFNAQGREKQSRSTGRGSGLGGEIELANSNGARGWEDRESSESWAACTEQPSSDSRGSESGQIREGQVWPSRPGEPQHAWEPPRVVANGHGRGQRECCKQDSIEIGLNQQSSQRNNACGCNEAMGNAEQLLFPAPREHGAMEQESGISAGERGEPSQTDSIAGATRKREGDGGNASEFSETEPPVGRDAHGSTRGMDYAELQVSCDNRTDELRLLGNGVVPATAERAFLTLWEELLKGTN
jgi:DNA (cytosine-5)-methyltransferase 1